MKKKALSLLKYETYVLPNDFRVCSLSPTKKCCFCPRKDLSPWLPPAPSTFSHSTVGWEHDFQSQKCSLAKKKSRMVLWTPVYICQTIEDHHILLKYFILFGSNMQLKTQRFAQLCLFVDFFFWPADIFLLIFTLI